MKRISCLWGITAVLLLCLVTAQTAGAATFPNDLLRPPSGGYFAPGQITWSNGYLGRNLLLWQPAQSWAPPALGDSVTHSFGGTMRLDLSTDGGLSWSTMSGSASEGVWTYHASGLPPSTRVFEEELTYLAWYGGSGLMIRESPTKASIGHTTISETTGGDYQIDSFFDVFVEISIDRGMSWYPSDGSTRADLMPEPGGLLALGSGLLALCGLIRRRK